MRTDIQTRFYAALAAQKRIKLAQEFKVVTKKEVQVAEDRMEAAVGTRPGILRSEIQVNNVELAIQRSEFDFEAAWKELAAVAGVPDLPPTAIIGSLNSDVPHRDSDSAFAQIVAQSPLLLSAHERVKRARANMQRQQAQATPNVTGQLGTGHDNATGDEFVNLQLSLPLPVHN